MNDVMNRALNSVRFPTRLEPTGLLLGSNLKPDGISLIPWTRGKPLAWDVTCAFPLAASWSSTALRGQSAVATAVEARKTQKYADLAHDFIFEPISLEVFGGMGEATQQFISKLGSKLLERDINKNAAFYFRQRLALSVQIGNSACILETLPEPLFTLFPDIL
jgi:hypothetical protein